MTKIARSLVLMAGMAGLITAGGMAVAPAQDKKDVKKDAKDTKGTKAAGGTVEVSAGKDGKYRFQIRDAEDKYLAGSGAYPTEDAAVKAVESLKSVLSSAKVVVAKKDDKKEKDKDK